MSEAEVQRRILIAANGLPAVRLFRNSVGYDERNRVRYGLMPGSADLIGWRVLPSGVAQFVSLEVKSASGRASADQLAWLEACKKAGCCAAIVRSVEEALEVLA